MRRQFHLFVAVALIASASVVSTATMARLAHGIPPEMAVQADQADAVLVIKSSRELRLIKADQIIRSYRVAPGAAPQGHKQSEGDERNPDGNYLIDWRNPNSIVYLSLHSSTRTGKIGPQPENVGKTREEIS